MLDATVAAGADFVRRVAAAAANIGEAVVDLVSYATQAAIAIGRAVVQGLIDAGKSLVTLVTSIASAGFNTLKKLVQIAFDLGRALVSVLRDLAKIAFSVLKDVVRAAFELGKTIVEFAGAMVEFTYAVAARLIQAAIEVGAAVADLLEAVVAKGYFVLRKLVTGVLQALGPVGDVFEWLIERGEALASELWRQAVLAIRFVKHSVTEILDWARAQGAAMFDAILHLDRGRRRGDQPPSSSGPRPRATRPSSCSPRRPGGSATASSTCCPTSPTTPSRRSATSSRAHSTPAWPSSTSWPGRSTARSRCSRRPCSRCSTSARPSPSSSPRRSPTPATPSTTCSRPSTPSARPSARSPTTCGPSARSRGRRSCARPRRSATPVVDILAAAWEIVGAALGAAVSILCSLLAGYRAMTPQEVAEARLVFDDALDYDHIFFAVDDVTNDIIFGIQDWVSGNSDSRAFVTDSLVNFDVDEGLSRRTMIHELTHVWQYQHTGSQYLADAVFAQATGDGVGDSGYNYGYREQASPTVTIPKDFGTATETGPVGDWMGEEGQDDLAGPAAATWDGLNPEMQAQVIMHWYVRKVLEGQTDAEVAPWQPYVDLVRAA